MEIMSVKCGKCVAKNGAKIILFFHFWPYLFYTIFWGLFGKSIFFFFYSCFHLYDNLPLTYPPPFPPFPLFPLSPSSLSYLLSLPPLPFPPPEPPSFLTARVTTHENVTAAILSYAVSHLHEGTGKLRKTCADTVGHLTESVPSLTVSEKWPPVQRFDVQAADRPSPIQVRIQRKVFFFFF